jgi:hypothetical protein
VQWSGRWDQQHDSVVLTVESICGQGFAYTHEVEERKAQNIVKLEQKEATEKTAKRRLGLIKISHVDLV